MFPPPRTHGRFWFAGRSSATANSRTTDPALHVLCDHCRRDHSSPTRWRCSCARTDELPSSSAAAAQRTSSSRPAPKSLPKVPTQPPPPWTWPTSGRVSVDFGGKPGTGTGILIDGKSGQSITAAAAGRVVYAGSGLIGYGQLIIIKHNDTYLSAYGYNASLLVKEGEVVKKGQRIATMGEGPERKARLHFEIRRNGKPVDPRQYLPAR